VPISALAAERVSRHGPFPGRLDIDRIEAYAAATGDETALVLAGQAVPAVFPVVLTFDAQEAANGDVPGQAWREAKGALHGEHDIVLHRPLTPGESLQTWSRISTVRTVPVGTQVVLYIEQFDADGVLTVEQWWTTVLLGLREMVGFGGPAPDHRFEESARARPLGSAVHHMDSALAHRYAEVSGDWSAHHFDITAARASGFDFLFAHGLCTMAVCAHRVLGLIGISDPGRVSRVAVRFASPTPLGSDLFVDAYGISADSFAFEATCAGVKTITHGRLELRP
jgi:acyl dehydratase